MTNALTIFDQLRPYTVGYDNIFDRFETMFDNDHFFSQTGNYPPYNIVKSGNNYTITLAVAGFSMSDLDISVQENELIISGKTNDSENNVEFLHKGIAGRSFERKFRLADTIKVSDANYENGLLHVFLEREIPEHQKPRKVEINNKIN